MNMPGFNAECALYSNHDRYLTRFFTAPSPQVIPQKINRACWNKSFNRTFRRCIEIGYGEYPCAAVATDLADSACDF